MQSFNILYWTECLWIYIWMRDLWPNDWNIKTIYVEPKNVILERYILSTRKQKAGESLDQFLNELKTAKTVISKQYLLNNLNLKWLEMLLLVEYNPIISARDYSKIKLLICRQLWSSLLTECCTTKFHYVSQPSILEVIAPIPRGEFEKCSINDTSLAVVKSKGKQNTQSGWFCGNSQYPGNNIQQKLLHAINVKNLDTMKNFVALQMCLLLYQDLLQCMTRITFLPVYLLVNHSFMKITCLPAYLPVNHTFKL